MFEDHMEVLVEQVPIQKYALVNMLQAMCEQITQLTETVRVLSNENESLRERMRDDKDDLQEQIREVRFYSNVYG